METNSQFKKNSKCQKRKKCEYACLLSLLRGLKTLYIHVYEICFHPIYTLKLVDTRVQLNPLRYRWGKSLRCMN